MSVWRQLWQHVERPLDGSGYWRFARLSRSDDDPDAYELETNTRSSVVPTTITLGPEDVERLRDALNREATR